MKLANSTLFKFNKIKNNGIPTCPKVVLLGSPNVDLRLFAHRIGIDLGIPVVSIKQIYRTILSFEEQYSSETFYRKVISILKNSNKAESALQLEAEMIPEKLLNLTKYTELGYVVYDYPNNVSQAKNLEQQSNGGINLALNLMLKKDIAFEKEKIKHQCNNCGREYYKGNLTFATEGSQIQEVFPEDGVCLDVRMKYIIYNK